MALDLNKPLGTTAPAASSALPTKTTMNLLVRERKNADAWKYILAGLTLALLVALFTKFAVLDVFKQVSLKNSELYAAQQELSAVQQQLSDYDRVLEEYRSYTGIATNGALDALQVMDMVTTVVQPAATITSVSTSDSVLVVSVKNISLDELGKLADALRAQDMVEAVSVTTATDLTNKGVSSQPEGEVEADAGVSATLQITLVSGVEEGGE